MDPDGNYRLQLLCVLHHVCIGVYAASCVCWCVLHNVCIGVG